MEKQYPSALHNMTNEKFHNAILPVGAHCTKGDELLLL
jgi:hypothetical protein